MRHLKERTIKIWKNTMRKSGMQLEEHSMKETQK
jgi:hypothetical protein